MRKPRIFAAALAVLITVLPFFAVTHAAGLSGFTVEWTGSSPALVAVAVWEYGGEAYEMAVTGLKKRLPDSTFEELALAFHAGEDAVLADAALTDAEKFSHTVPHEAGDPETWVVKDDVRNTDNWGDSLLCWAASAANMLSATGWITEAEDPKTSVGFTDEDEVFSYLTKCFFNDGNYQEEGVRWFFGGKVNDASRLRDGAEPKKLIAEDPERYMTAFFAEDKGRSACTGIGDMVQKLKKGAAMGISVSAYGTAYKLLAHPDTEVTAENGQYVEYRFYYVDADEFLTLPEHYWTFDADGGLILLEKHNNAYTDAGGKEYPALSVKKDRLYYDAGTGTWLLPTPDNNSPDYTVTHRVIHPASEVDLTHPVYNTGLGNGGHAITVSGYIRNVSDSRDETRGLRAMLIADSDNDAGIWQINDSTVKKEDRPDTYTLCYTDTRDISGTVTVDLTNYLPDGDAYIAYACLLYPKGFGPVPGTGDKSSPGVYAALLLGTLAGIVLLKKKRVL